MHWGSGRKKHTCWEQTVAPWRSCSAAGAGPRTSTLHRCPTLAQPWHAGVPSGRGAEAATEAAMPGPRPSRSPAPASPRTTRHHQRFWGTLRPPIITAAGTGPGTSYRPALATATPGWGEDAVLRWRCTWLWRTGARHPPPATAPPRLPARTAPAGPTLLLFSLFFGVYGVRWDTGAVEF